MPEEHISNQPSSESIDYIRQLDGWVLNLGAGGTTIKLTNCVELEYSIFRHTDVAADAHWLPFGDGVFDAVVTFNTFEHLYDPNRAAKEIFRVLKPGGRLILQTAYLQPVHEAPYHFYPTTEYGLRHWFRDFENVQVCVTPNFNPAHVFAWLTWEMLQAVEATHGAAVRQQFANSTMDFWNSTWADAKLRDHTLWKSLGELPQEVQKRIAAGFQLDAVRPAALNQEGSPSTVQLPVNRNRKAPGRTWSSRSMSQAGRPRVPSLAMFRVLFVVRPGVYDAASMRYCGYNVIEALQSVGIEAAHLDECHIPDRLDEVISYDLVVLVRRCITPNTTLLFDRAREMGVPVVCDFDDLLFDERIIAHVAVSQGLPLDESGRLRQMIGVLERSDYCTASTPHIVKYAEEAGKLCLEIPNGLNAAANRLVAESSRRSQFGQGRKSPAVGLLQRDSHTSGRF